MKHNKIDTNISGRIKRSREIPADFMATNSKLSPRFPKVIIEEIRMAIGIAKARREAPAYQINCPMVTISKPLPTKSSIYFQSICIINTNTAMKKVIMKGPIKVLRISLSNFFIIRLQANFLRLILLP